MELDPARLAVLADTSSAAGCRALVELFDAFLADTWERLRSIRAALAAGDLTEVRGLAHAQKGASGMVGAVRIAAGFAAIETAACDRTETEAQIGMIEESLSRLRGELARHLTHGAPP